jgi:hypothetical protein
LDGTGEDMRVEDWTCEGLVFCVGGMRPETRHFWVSFFLNSRRPVSPKVRSCVGFCRSGFRKADSKVWFFTKMVLADLIPWSIDNKMFVSKV